MSHHHHRGGDRDPSFEAKSRTTWEVIRRVARYIRPYPWYAAGTIACALLSLAAAFAYPRLTQMVIDEVIGARRADLLPPVMIGLLVAMFLRDAFNSLRILLNNTFEQHVIFDMRRDVYARLQRLPVGYFDQRASGDLMTRVIEDVNSVERVLIDGTEQGTVAVLSILGVLVLLLSTNPLLAAVALIPVPILAGGALWYTTTAHKRYRLQRQASSAMNALLMDNLQGVRQIKAFGREDHEDERFRQRAEDLRQGTLTIMRVWALYSPAMSFAAALGTGLVLWIGGRQVLAGHMTLGELIGFLFYLALFYEPVGRLHGLNQMLQAARAAGERVFDILDATEEASANASANADPDAQPPNTQASGGANPASGGGGLVTNHLPAPPPGWRASGLVTMDQVHFEYSPGKVALRTVSLQAPEGTMTALVGPTGAGKSTLVNLLMGFYRAGSGRIRIDGYDVSAMPLKVLREQIAIVSQEPFLFNGTIRENLLYGRLDATTAQVDACAQAANCYEFIARLPEGYDSRVGERGVKLSVGEKQRISIARALLKDAPILILDEATASVDTGTERLIQEALDRLMAGRTSFVIAHRLSTIRLADQILVLRQGEIAERGTHEELLAKGGLYARLSTIQHATFIEEGFQKLPEGAA